MKTTTLEFKWTVSHGRDTYGYNVCTLYAGGRKVARCNGGGYDMKGTCLGIFLARAYAERLRELKLRDMPEHSHWQSDNRRVCDGVCKQQHDAALLEAIAKDAPEPKPLPLLPQDSFECPVCGGSTRASCGGQTVKDGRYFYGLTFHDPNYDPGRAVIGKDCSDRTLSSDGSQGQTVEQAEAAGKSFGLERYQAIYAASSKHATERHTVPDIDGACGFSSVEKIAEAIGLSLESVRVSSQKLDVYQLHDRQPEAAQAAA